MSASTVTVSPDQLADAICAAVKDWQEVAQAGELRVTPNPVSRSTYLIIAGQHIVQKIVLRQDCAC